MSITPEAGQESLSKGSYAFMAEPGNQSGTSPFIARCVEISKIIPTVEVRKGEVIARDIAVVSSETPLSDGRNRAVVPLNRLFTEPALREAMAADPDCEKAIAPPKLSLLVLLRDSELNKKMAVAMVKAELGNDLARIPTKE